MESVRKKYLVAGHLGPPELYPENTIISFRKAIEAAVMLRFGNVNANENHKNHLKMY